MTIEDVHDLTATPLGDEQKLIIRGDKAAFATASYGKIETITLLDLVGKADAADNSLLDSATAAITNWQETGASAGIGRLDVNLDAPLDQVILALDDEHLLIGSPSGKSLAVQLATGTIAGDASALGAHASSAPALHKRPILWAVDTVRAEVGPEPVAAVEAAIFNLRDLMRRTTYSIFRSERQSRRVRFRKLYRSRPHNRSMRLIRKPTTASGRPRRSPPSGRIRSREREPGSPLRILGSSGSQRMLRPISFAPRSAPIPTGPTPRSWWSRWTCASSSSTWRRGSKIPSRSPEHMARAKSHATPES